MVYHFVIFPFLSFLSKNPFCSIRSCAYGLVWALAWRLLCSSTFFAGHHIIGDCYTKVISRLVYSFWRAWEEGRGGSSGHLFYPCPEQRLRRRPFLWCPSDPWVQRPWASAWGLVPCLSPISRIYLSRKERINLAWLLCSVVLVELTTWLFWCYCSVYAFAGIAFILASNLWFEC